MTHPARALLGTLACALLLVGCGADPYPGEPDGTLHVPLIEEVKGLDPTQSDEEMTSLCVMNIYDQLYQYHHLKRPFTLEPGLAESMPEISADGLTLTVRLKKGVRFADDPCFTATGGKGRELVASDIVFCFQRLMDHWTHSPGTWLIEGYVRGLDAFHEASAGTPERHDRAAYPTSEGFPEVEGLQAPDPHTVVLGLTKPYPEMPLVLAMPYFSIYPREAIAHYGQEFLNHAVGSGPYVVESFARSQKLVLVRNPTYRDERYPSDGMPEDEALGRLRGAGERLPRNVRVVATVLKEDQPRWLYFLGGALDRISLPRDSFDASVDKATRELNAEMRGRGVVLEKDPRPEIIYDLFNFRDPVIGHAAGEKGLAIRRAMSLAFDLEWATHHLYNDRVTPVHGPILEEFPEYDPAFVNPWRRGAGETMEQARERARALLAGVGYAGGKGLPPIEMDVQDTTLDEQFFLAFADDMAKVGIRMTARRTSWSEMIRRQRLGQGQMSGLAWGADYPAAQNFLQLFYGPNESPGSNSSNYKNPEFDALFEQAAALPPGEQRTALYRKMQEIVVRDCVWIFKYRRTNWNLSQPWMDGFRWNDISNKFFQYCRVDSARRRELVSRWNPRHLAPLVIAGGLVVLLVGVTVVSARRQVKGW